MSAGWEHNALQNVDTLNSDEAYWKKARASDKKFIDQIYKDFIRMAGVEDGMCIGDFGCGTGVLVSKLAEDFPCCKIIGFDFSKQKIERCKEFYRLGSENFQVSSVYDPIDRKFDLIVATEVLEHLEYPKQACANLLLGLNVGGRLFLTVPEGRNDTFPGHIHFWSPESWWLFIKDTVGDSAQVETGILANKNYALVRID